MGGWKLETARMGIYVFFPVAMFYCFNRTELFEKYVTDKIKLMYPPESKMHRKEFDELRDKMEERVATKQKKQEEQSLHLMEAARTSQSS
ncbi:protein PET100 homolog, mitochondrial-like [Patiria miniata]|uniref:Protein PET100 homolog, mitochondrial n=1 Tax=Patiria miniata TaxID=46514 RepID=A0A913ZDJ1_PATMI|nr:protein PET100 homolog, mitochondrial-like [Patiria miniata]